MTWWWGHSDSSWNTWYCVFLHFTIPPVLTQRQWLLIDAIYTSSKALWDPHWILRVWRAPESCLRTGWLLLSGVEGSWLNGHSQHGGPRWILTLTSWPKYTLPPKPTPASGGHLLPWHLFPQPLAEGMNITPAWPCWSAQTIPTLKRENGHKEASQHVIFFSYNLTAN